MSSNRNPVGWFEIYVQDMERARAFYEKTLQVTLQRLDAPDPSMEIWAFPMHSETPGAPGALVKMAGKDSGGGGIIIYFSCADCAIEAERVTQYGGQLQRPKFPIGPYGFIAFVSDSEGNLIGLHSME